MIYDRSKDIILYFLIDGGRSGGTHCCVGELLVAEEHKTWSGTRIR